MEKILKTAILLFATATVSSCYDDYVSDYDYSSVGFALQNPLRTVVADRTDPVYVGVYVGGKRSVDMNDYAKFRIDPDLLAGTSFTLLPESHYTLASPDRFTIRRSNIPLADVEIKFTEAFFDDPLSISNTYALPLAITDHSLDRITEGKESTVIVFKYISQFSGTYYVRGSVETLDDEGEVVGEPRLYYNNDISQNFTRPIVTLSRYSVRRNGVAELALSSANRVTLTITDPESTTGEYNVAISKGDHADAVEILEGSGKYIVAAAEGERNRYELKYKYVSAGVTYRVEESLYLQLDPADALRVETW